MINYFKNRLDRLSSLRDLSTSNILEIGALDSPTLSPDNYSIKFLDFASAEELSSKNEGHPRYAIERLVNVDYICPSLNYTEFVHEKFDIIIANHVIEHVSNTISWINELSKLLKDKGILFLSVPDKRYTFDIARNTTTFIDLVRSYNEKTTKPTFYQILDHIYFYKKIKVQDIFNGDYLEKLKANRFTPREAFDTALRLSKLDYADVHCHVYTNTSFLETFSILEQLKLINLKLSEVTEPVKYSNEFYAVFERY